MSIDSRGATPSGVIPGASAHSQAATGAPMTTDPGLDETRAGMAIRIDEVSKTFGRATPRWWPWTGCPSPSPRVSSSA